MAFEQAFEFHDVVYIFHTLFERAVLTHTKLTQCLEELKYQLWHYIWILTLTMTLYYSVWFKMSVSVLECKICVIMKVILFHVCTSLFIWTFTCPDFTL